MATKRRRTIGWGCLGALLLALSAFLFVARPFLFPKHYDVVSIATLGEYKDTALMTRAWALPVAKHYLDATVTFQPNGSLCGPTSLANVSRSLGEPNVSPHAILEGSGKCRFDMCFGGLTLDELGDLATTRLHRHVTVLRDLDLAAFRAHLPHTNDLDRRYVINFDRGPLFGTAGGHHSPIAGYLASDDLVLVIDVNAKYTPWLVKSERLYQAMDTVDPSTGKKRGLLLIQ